MRCSEHVISLEAVRRLSLRVYGTCIINLVAKRRQLQRHVVLREPRVQRIPGGAANGHLSALNAEFTALVGPHSATLLNDRDVRFAKSKIDTGNRPFLALKKLVKDPQIRHSCASSSSLYVWQLFSQVGEALHDPRPCGHKGPWYRHGSRAHCL
jgi:hypothetical protein